MKEKIIFTPPIIKDVKCYHCNKITRIPVQCNPILEPHIYLETLHDKLKMYKKVQGEMEKEFQDMEKQVFDLGGVPKNTERGRLLLGMMRDLLDKLGGEEEI